jgi:7,8-dihydropterin-6-yl-methyl-4-(beta-D-ribofuranosyl)aminobenzene 5'-phosphate synthase
MKRIILISVLLLAPVLVVFFGTRQVSARQTVAKDWENSPTIIPNLEATSRLEILPLYEEASIHPDLNSGHGVSYMIRTDTATLLLDIGDNPEKDEIAPFMQNMRSMYIDWSEIDQVVISHLHPDHIGGLTAWNQHMIAFGNLPDGIDEPVIFVPDAVRKQGAIHVTIPTLLAPDVATTGAIAYLEPWPLSLRNPLGYEQALVIHVAGQGLVVITGCGHPTLKKLIMRAESLYELPVVGVVGGLHYEGAIADELQPDVQFLQSRNPVLVALSSHDSSREALVTFENAFPESYQMLRVGETIQFSGE